jgi:hypothetical protein
VQSKQLQKFDLANSPHQPIASRCPFFQKTGVLEQPANITRRRISSDKSILCVPQADYTVESIASAQPQPD